MPDRIGKYEIRGEIGKGGFGKVFRGFDPTVGRLVAIKVLSSGGDANVLARFRTEATAAGNLHHKNIVTIFEFGEDHGTFFLVMEYLEGRDLQHALPEANSLKLVDKMNIMSQVAEGLQCAHQNGIVHRDIKPANIMLLADGTVKIMDFGIARLTHANSARLTQSGFLIGTLSYMAPELLNGAEADALCDIWAFGTIYYELLCGQHPFEASDAASAMYRIMSTEPRRIRSVYPDCPEALDHVIARLLAKDRDLRYQTLEDVLFDTTPILLELQSQQAGRLVPEAEELIRGEKLEEAEPVIRRILEIDPLHPEGRALRKELQLALKKRSVQTRVRSLREQSEKFASARNFDDAIRALDAALGMDSTNSELSARLQEMHAAKERFELARQSLSRARADLEQNNLTAAFQAATDAVQAEPGNSEARSLLGAVRERITERDTEKRLREGLSQVKGLIALQSFDEAVALIETLNQQGTDSAELRELLERTRTQSEEHHRERQIRTEIDAAKDAIKNRRFEEAVAKLSPLANEPARKAEVAGLLAYANEELTLAQRAAKIKSLGKEAWALLKAKDLEGALARVDEGLRMFPDEAVLLKLRQAALTERAQTERDKAIRQALEESASLGRAGQWEQAMAPLEKALWTYPEEAALRTAFDQAKKKLEEQQQAARLAALENELKQAHRLIEEGQPGSATQLLQHLTVSYPGEAAVMNLLDRARAEEQRRSGLEALYAEIRRSMQSGRPEDALDAIARGRQQFGPDAQLLTLEREAEKSRARNEGLEQARQAFRASNWKLAEKTLEGILAQGTDAEAQSLLDDVRKESWAEQREQLRSRGRKEAEKLLQSNRFDDAVRSLRALCDQFPEDTGFPDQLREALEAQERQARREAYGQARKQADALLQTGKFDAAIAAIEKLLVQFPQDSTLQEDLKAAGEAKLQQERRTRYNSERQRAAELVRNRKFDEAIRVLEAMRPQFPGDLGIEEDLRSASAAKGYQTERFQVNERVSKLEQFYRQGKAATVKELAAQLLAEIEEPRARELYNWADETLKRPPSGIQPGILPVPPAKNRYLVWAGLIVILLLVIGAAVKFAKSPEPPAQPVAVQPVVTPPPTQTATVQTPEQLILDPTEVSFEWQIGSNSRLETKTISVRATGSDQKWQATAGKDENWIVVTPGETSFNVTVDPVRLGQGSYQGFVTVKLGQAQSFVQVKLAVKPPLTQAGNTDKGPSNPGNTKPGPGSIVPGGGVETPSGAGTSQQTASPTATPSGNVATPKPQPKQLPVFPSRDCGPRYTGRNSGTLIWTGSLKPEGVLVFTRDDAETPFDGGGLLRGQALPGCEVSIEIPTRGINIDEGPTAQNRFAWIKLRNQSGMTVDTVTLRWTKTK